MVKPRIHITAVGSPAPDVLQRLGVRNVAGLAKLAQAGAGDRYKVTASAKMILASEVDNQGGRSDDDARAREIESVLADDRVAALVTIRGGAWFARLLDQIDWDVLRRRRSMIHIFGFSEMTTLVAIASQYPRAVGLYDLGPTFIFAGMKRWALQNISTLVDPAKMSADERQGFAAGWATAEFPREFTEFFGEVAGAVEGRGAPRVPTGELLAGSLPSRSRITITGGNLSLLMPLLGSRFAAAIDTRGKWLAIEDLNEPADKIDRMIAALKLAGLFERAQGVILGDFHNKDDDLTAAACKVLRYHLPERRTPIVRINNFGHIWPIAPLPMNRPVTLVCRRRRRGKPSVSIEIPWREWAR
ncbi:MAG TPA: LD-carboxypeptidase [Phycisphaerae bacterium]|nr:LD-carboxypeptidase [Phycisphaerae bacterium]HRY69841.1 LD-carboxypeptidase [Phycisphaerae bacterium]HSA25432.1 LD-carboxypeptidase [Phycisphaerae bacterium]